MRSAADVVTQLNISCCILAEFSDSLKASEESHHIFLSLGVSQAATYRPAAALKSVSPQVLVKVDLWILLAAGFYI